MRADTARRTLLEFTNISTLHIQHYNTVELNAQVIISHQSLLCMSGSDIKEAVCSFVEEMLMSREKSSLAIYFQTK